MSKKTTHHYSGIGGQAVIEGVMMKNKEKYAVAVRKPNGEIEVDVQNYEGILPGSKLKEIPFIRGVFNFIDSLVLGNKTLTYSASFYDEEEEGKKTSKAMESFLTGLVVFISIALAIGIFILLPYFISSQFEHFIQNRSLLLIMEGAIRILIFLLYVWGISAMKDIRRVYQYHGAEHKCINCIEKGRPLTVSDVKRSSRLHKRCGTSFIFFVMLVSIILFFFIRVDNILMKVCLRVALMPVVAGISYEIIRLAGRTDNIIVKILSAPGMLIQRITTKEPDEDMIKVAICSVEAIFDWKQYLYDTFGYEVDESWLAEDGEEVYDESYEDEYAEPYEENPDGNYNETYEENPEGNYNEAYEENPDGNYEGNYEENPEGYYFDEDEADANTNDSNINVRTDGASDNNFNSENQLAQHDQKEEMPG